MLDLLRQHRRIVPVSRSAAHDLAGVLVPAVGRMGEYFRHIHPVVAFRRIGHLRRIAPGLMPGRELHQREVRETPSVYIHQSDPHTANIQFRSPAAARRPTRCPAESLYPFADASAFPFSPPRTTWHRRPAPSLRAARGLLSLFFSSFNRRLKVIWSRFNRSRICVFYVQIVVMPNLVIVILRGVGLVFFRNNALSGVVALLVPSLRSAVVLTLRWLQAFTLHLGRSCSKARPSSRDCALWPVSQ